MACEVYFSISKTAIELIVLGVITASAVYLIRDLTEETSTEVNSTEG